MVHFADAPGRAPWLFGSLPSGSVSRGARPQNDASAEMAIGSPDRQRALAVSTTMHARRVHPPLLLFSEHLTCALLDSDPDAVVWELRRRRREQARWDV